MADTGRAAVARLPLRWGRHADRVVSGLALVIAGAVAVAGSNALVPWFVAMGLIAHAAGWAILPAAGWRRILAAAVSTPAMLLLLAGPRYIGVLVVAYLAWLLVRHRPARAWPTALLPVAAAVVVGTTAPTTGGMLPTLALMGAVLVVAAWIAAALSSGRLTARSRRIRSRGRPADS
jgi:hypothetical protein